MERLEAVIFDFDGTIVDTEKLFYKTLSGIMNDWFSVELDKLDYINNVSGTNEETSRKYFTQKYGVEDYDAFEKEIVYRMTRDYNEAQVLTNIEESFKLLKEQNIKIAIASNGNKGHIISGLELKGLYDYIDLIVTKEDVINPKPAPDIYLKVAKDLDVNIKNCVVVEDSVPGALAGVRSGAFVIVQTNDITKYMDFSDVDYDEKDVNLLESIKNKIK